MKELKRYAKYSLDSEENKKWSSEVTHDSECFKGSGKETVQVLVIVHCDLGQGFLHYSINSQQVKPDTERVEKRGCWDKDKKRWQYKEISGSTLIYSTDIFFFFLVTLLIVPIFLFEN